MSRTSRKFTRAEWDAMPAAEQARLIASVPDEGDVTIWGEGEAVSEVESRTTPTICGWAVWACETDMGPHAVFRGKVDAETYLAWRQTPDDDGDCFSPDWCVLPVFLPEGHVSDHYDIDKAVSALAVKVGREPGDWQ